MTTERQPSPAEDPGLPLAPVDGEIKQKRPAAPVLGHDTRIEEAETHTKQAEARTDQAELRTVQAEQSEQRVRASEINYRRLFEAAKDGILILDAETGKVMDVNPFLTEMLGFSHSEMIGKTVAELSPFKDFESNQVMLERLQKDGYVRYEHLPPETRSGRKFAVEHRAIRPLCAA